MGNILLIACLYQCVHIVLSSHSHYSVGHSTVHQQPAVESACELSHLRSLGRSTPYPHLRAGLSLSHQISLDSVLRTLQKAYASSSNEEDRKNFNYLCQKIKEERSGLETTYNQEVFGGSSFTGFSVPYSARPSAFSPPYSQQVTQLPYNLAHTRFNLPHPSQAVLWGHSPRNPNLRVSDHSQVQPEPNHNTVVPVDCPVLQHPPETQIPEESKDLIERKLKELEAQPAGKWGDEIKVKVQKLLKTIQPDVRVVFSGSSEYGLFIRYLSDVDVLITNPVFDDKSEGTEYLKKLREQFLQKKGEGIANVKFIPGSNFPMVSFTLNGDKIEILLKKPSVNETWSTQDTRNTLRVFKRWNIRKLNQLLKLYLTSRNLNGPGALTSYMIVQMTRFFLGQYNAVLEGKSVTEILVHFLKMFGQNSPFIKDDSIGMMFDPTITEEDGTKKIFKAYCGKGMVRFPNEHIFLQNPQNTYNNVCKNVFLAPDLKMAFEDLYNSIIHGKLDDLEMAFSLPQMPVTGSESAAAEAAATGRPPGRDADAAAAAGGGGHDGVVGGAGAEPADTTTTSVTGARDAMSEPESEPDDSAGEKLDASPSAQSTTPKGDDTRQVYVSIPGGDNQGPLKPVNFTPKTKKKGNKKGNKKNKKPQAKIAASTNDEEDFDKLMANAKLYNDTVNELAEMAHKDRIKILLDNLQPYLQGSVIRKIRNKIIDYFFCFSVNPAATATTGSSLGLSTTRAAGTTDYVKHLNELNVGIHEIKAFVNKIQVRKVFDEAYDAMRDKLKSLLGMQSREQEQKNRSEVFNQIVEAFLVYFLDNDVLHQNVNGKFELENTCRENIYSLILTCAQYLVIEQRKQRKEKRKAPRGSISGPEGPEGPKIWIDTLPKEIQAFHSAWDIIIDPNMQNPLSKMFQFKLGQNGTRTSIQFTDRIRTSLESGGLDIPRTIGDVIELALRK